MSVRACSLSLPGALLLLAVLTGCTAGPVRPLTEAPQRSNLANDETRLWDMAEEGDEEIAKGGQIYRSEALRSYLQSIMDRLYPEFRGRLQVQVIDSPVVNAFALPNGSIYVHLGMLSQLENEAQLATVLAHEGAHFVNRHSLQQRRSTKSSLAAANVVALLGVPLVGELAAVSSIYGYSRDMEREADRIGWERLTAAGYAGREAEGTFRHLLEELKAMEIEEPVFFSSHPKLQERIDSFHELAEGYRGNGEIGEARYLEATAEARLDAIEADLGSGRFASVILVLENEERLAHYPPSALFYLGEAYRRRGGEGDRDQAVKAYGRCLEYRPGFAPPYRALGLLQLKQEEYALARESFTRYLELDPGAADRAYVENYLKRISKELDEP